MKKAVSIRNDIDLKSPFQYRHQDADNGSDIIANFSFPQEMTFAAKGSVSRNLDGNYSNLPAVLGLKDQAQFKLAYQAGQNSINYASKHGNHLLQIMSRVALPHALEHYYTKNQARRDNGYFTDDPNGTGFMEVACRAEDLHALALSTGILGAEKLAGKMSRYMTNVELYSMKFSQRPFTDRDEALVTVPAESGLFTTTISRLNKDGDHREPGVTQNDPHRFITVMMTHAHPNNRVELRLVCERKE